MLEWLQEGELGGDGSKMEMEIRVCRVSFEPAGKNWGLTTTSALLEWNRIFLAYSLQKPLPVSHARSLGCAAGVSLDLTCTARLSGPCKVWF